MKRLFAFLLVICLVLCGCEMGGNTPTKPNTPGQSQGGETNDPTSGQSAEPTRPVIVEPITADSPALCISVHINPMLELYLNFSNEIVEVKAINADAEKLLAEQELIGKSYDEGIAVVLAEAEQQGFLKNQTKVYIGAREIIAGTWMQNSEEMMRNPFENYQKNSGVTLNCEFTPGGKSTPAIHSTHTNEREDFTEVICYEATGMQILTKLFYDNGDYCEMNLYTGITYTWYADGRYSCYYLKDGLQEWYVLHPDGRVDWVKAKPDETGQGYAWYLEINDDGSSREYFTENGNAVKDIYVEADGSSYEISYFYENGKLVREMTRHSDGSSNETWFIKQTYYESGNVETYTEFREGIYVEQYYDENGLMVSLFQRDPDGTEYDWDYENGEAVGYTVTYPDGSSEYHSYSP